MYHYWHLINGTLRHVLPQQGTEQRVTMGSCCFDGVAHSLDFDSVNSSSTLVPISSTSDINHTAHTTYTKNNSKTGRQSDMNINDCKANQSDNDIRTSCESPCKDERVTGAGIGQTGIGQTGIGQTGIGQTGLMEHDLHSGHAHGDFVTGNSCNSQGQRSSSRNGRKRPGQRGSGSRYHIDLQEYINKELKASVSEPNALSSPNIGNIAKTNIRRMKLQMRLPERENGIIGTIDGNDINHNILFCENQNDSKLPNKENTLHIIEQPTEDNVKMKQVRSDKSQSNKPGSSGPSPTNAKDDNIAINNSKLNDIVNTFSKNVSQAMSRITSEEAEKLKVNLTMSVLNNTSDHDEEEKKTTLYGECAESLQSNESYIMVQSESNSVQLSLQSLSKISSNSPMNCTAMASDATIHAMNESTAENLTSVWDDASSGFNNCVKDGEPKLENTLSDANEGKISTPEKKMDTRRELNRDRRSSRKKKRHIDDGIANKRCEKNDSQDIDTSTEQLMHETTVAKHRLRPPYQDLDKNVCYAVRYFATHQKEKPSLILHTNKAGVRMSRSTPIMKSAYINKSIQMINGSESYVVMSKTLQTNKQQIIKDTSHPDFEQRRVLEEVHDEKYNHFKLPVGEDNTDVNLKPNNNEKSYIGDQEMTNIDENDTSESPSLKYAGGNNAAVVTPRCAVRQTVSDGSSTGAKLPFWQKDAPRKTRYSETRHYHRAADLLHDWTFPISRQRQTLSTRSSSDIYNIASLTGSITSGQKVSMGEATSACTSDAAPTDMDYCEESSFCQPGSRLSKTPLPTKDACLQNSKLKTYKHPARSILTKLDTNQEELSLSSRLDSEQLQDRRHLSKTKRPLKPKLCTRSPSPPKSKLCTKLSGAAKPNTCTIESIPTKPTLTAINPRICKRTTCTIQPCPTMGNLSKLRSFPSKSNSCTIELCPNNQMLSKIDPFPGKAKHYTNYQCAKTPMRYKANSRPGTPKLCTVSSQSNTQKLPAIESCPGTPNISMQEPFPKKLKSSTKDHCLGKTKVCTSCQTDDQFVEKTTQISGDGHSYIKGIHIGEEQNKAQKSCIRNVSYTVIKDSSELDDLFTKPPIYKPVVEEQCDLSSLGVARSRTSGDIICDTFTLPPCKRNRSRIWYSSTKTVGKNKTTQAADDKEVNQRPSSCNRNTEISNKSMKRDGFHELTGNKTVQENGKAIPHKPSNGNVLKKRPASDTRTYRDKYIHKNNRGLSLSPQMNDMKTKSLSGISSSPQPPKPAYAANYVSPYRSPFRRTNSLNVSKSPSIERKKMNNTRSIKAPNPTPVVNKDGPSQNLTENRKESRSHKTRQDGASEDENGIPGDKQTGGKVESKKEENLSFLNWIVSCDDGLVPKKSDSENVNVEDYELKCPHNSFVKRSQSFQLNRKHDLCEDTPLQQAPLHTGDAEVNTGEKKDVPLRLFPPRIAARGHYYPSKNVVCVTVKPIGCKIESENLGLQVRVLCNGQLVDKGGVKRQQTTPTQQTTPRLPNKLLPRRPSVCDLPEHRSLLDPRCSQTPFSPFSTAIDVEARAEFLDTDCWH